MTESDPRRATPWSKLNQSGYKGVSWYPRGKRWRAQVNFNGKKIHLGYFDDVHDAGIAASDYRIQHAEELDALQERARQSRRQIITERLANLSPEENKERVRANFSGTAEELSERSKKGWETRRKNMSAA